MKKTQITLSLLATLFTLLAASAQGEWKWAHYWTGGDGTLGSYYNEITNTAFDEEGNIYVYGSMGGSPQFDGLTFLFVNNGTVLDRNDHSILLAKFDTLGNMLWYKVVKSSSETAFPLWMEIRNNKVYISGNCGFYGDYSDDWLYYLDTLVYKYQLNNVPEEQQELPFKAYHRWTFFAQLDLDGNLLEDHFVEAYSRDSFFNGADSIRTDETLCMPDYTAPFHIGNDGSMYVYTRILYRGNENSPYSIQIDGDTNKYYDLYLPGSVGAFGNINNAILYKFSSNWELDFTKLLVSHTDGIASLYPLINDSVTRYYYVRFRGMSFDENDNMYLTGNVQVVDSDPTGEQHQYPIHIWWDSTHNLTIHDISSLNGALFILKINTDGDFIWSNQLYTRGSNITARAIWNQCAYLDGSVYVLGGAAYNNDGESLVYFDNENNPLQRFQTNITDICFFVRYNKDNGEYICHGIVPATGTAPSLKPAVVNNRVFALSRFENSYGYGFLLSEWENDGTFIKADTIQNTGTIQLLHSIGAVVNDNGYVLVSVQATSPVTFHQNVSVNCPSSQSSAVFALYHNPEFTQPFVPDDSVGLSDYLGKRESDIYIYPNPTSGEAVVCGYMYGYTGIELYDLQGRKLADLVETGRAPSLQPAPSSSLPMFDLSPYPAGTYLVKINFERGVSVVRKVVKS